ncbi:MAG TPA: HNH endonuclease [Candidatus Angelobacter sp.]|nr:HNH endonuclease [Candidatus Angelobacter sp.]
MKNKKLDAVQVWKQCEDLAIPRLHLNLVERAVYYHLLRHSRLERKLELRFSIGWLARGACLSTGSVRQAVRSLVAKGALRLVERSKAGHTVEVRLPEEIRAISAVKTEAATATRAPRKEEFETADFLATRELREAIHRREAGRCFYCMKRVSPMTRCLDHVVPQVRKGSNSYRNVVSCCGECNSLKTDRQAKEFVRWLYREGHLTSAEFRGRVRALAALAGGKLRPQLRPSARSAQPALPGAGKVKIPRCKTGAWGTRRGARHAR